MKTRLDWSDPEVRRDARIVIALFVLGFIVNITLGLIFALVLDLLDLWGTGRREMIAA